MCVHFGGAVIAGLSPGDVIKIREGFGHPPADGDSIEIVAKVDGMSALTASGRRLACFDGCGVEPIGLHYEEFEISPEAQKILDEIEARG